MAKPLSIDRDVERRLAVELFNHTWTLLETPERTAEQDLEMIHSAHASCFHWTRASADPLRAVRGEWQISHVYALLGREEPALHHARACMRIVERHAIEGFDCGIAHEALARAYLVTGDMSSAREHARSARSIAATIEDAEDRAKLRADLATLPQELFGS